MKAHIVTIILVFYILTQQWKNTKSCLNTVQVLKVIITTASLYKVTFLTGVHSYFQ